MIKNIWPWDILKWLDWTFSFKISMFDQLSKLDSCPIPKIISWSSIFFRVSGRKTHIKKCKLQIYVVSLFWYVSWISLLKILLQKMYTLWCRGCKNSLCFNSCISTSTSTACALIFSTAYGSFSTFNVHSISNRKGPCPKYFNQIYMESVCPQCGLHISAENLI